MHKEDTTKGGGRGTTEDKHGKQTYQHRNKTNNKHKPITHKHNNINKYIIHTPSSKGKQTNNNT